jgi:hypothetical protein
MERKAQRNKRILLIILIITIVVLLVIWWYAFWGKSGNYVVVEIDGLEDARFLLDRDTTYRIQVGEDSYNELVIEKGRAYVAEADCAGQDCVHFAPISHQGQSIVCLPHKVNIYIVADSAATTERNYDAMAN